MELNKLQNLVNECIMIEQGNYLGGDFSVDLKQVQIELDQAKQLTLTDVMSRLPDSDEIRQKAQQMDEKEFDQWWWETVYKAN